MCIVNKEKPKNDHNGPGHGHEAEKHESGKSTLNLRALRPKGIKLRVVPLRFNNQKVLIRINRLFRVADEWNQQRVTSVYKWTNIRCFWKFRQLEFDNSYFDLEILRLN